MVRVMDFRVGRNRRSLRDDPDRDDGPVVLFYDGSAGGGIDEAPPHFFMRGGFLEVETPADVEVVREWATWVLEHLPEPPPEPTHTRLILRNVSYYLPIDRWPDLGWFRHGEWTNKEYVSDDMSGALSTLAEQGYPTEDVVL